MEEQYCKQLLQMVKKSIEFGLINHSVLPIDINEFPPVFREQRATFVTLHLQGELRGCIGTLKAHQPFIVDLVKNAFSAAFNDPRFPALTEREFRQLHYHVSIISEPTSMKFTSEDDLLSQLKPGIDGLILTEGLSCGTFLPSVWEQLPDKVLFLNHLKQKAGFALNYWSDEIQVERYRVDRCDGE